MTVSIGLGRVGSKFFHLYWVGLGQSADGLGWIGSHKMDPWTTLWRAAVRLAKLEHVTIRYEMLF